VGGLSGRMSVDMGSWWCGGREGFGGRWWIKGGWWVWVFEDGSCSIVRRREEQHGFSHFRS